MLITKNDFDIMELVFLIRAKTATTIFIVINICMFLISTVGMIIQRPQPIWSWLGYSFLVGFCTYVTIRLIITNIQDTKRIKKLKQELNLIS